ncbi:hypothetical protein PIB30_062542 [Stylosanthes scabra]|uniref:Uncharacterized protein n=1 Tax=Stylosanthes scabra TaxID=79078 RepID=A0ABU6UM26_9FABA|nr:hypothetical protein [Stylosanthes scabra]
MHAFGLDWEKKMERVDKRLKVVEGRIASQTEGLQSLEEGMNTHFSRRAQHLAPYVLVKYPVPKKVLILVMVNVAVNSLGTLLCVERMKSEGVTQPLSSYSRHSSLHSRPLRS